MSALHVHALRGCAPRPLSAYLKALAVLRIVCEQADSAARGFWREDGFVLITRLDEAALVRFFLYDWAPSPAVSPWNKGSGLLGEDPKGVGPVEKSAAPRFAALREGIRAARALTSEMAEAVRTEKQVKDEKSRLKDKDAKDRLSADPVYRQRLARAAKDCKRLKDALQPECQRRWRGPALRWLRAAVVLASDETATFPALLGTGGNDGKLDFTNNALQRIADLFDLAKGTPKPGAEESLRAALFGEAGPVMVSGGIGQFSPASSGGANAGAGALADSALNPWDLPLLLEGALLFTAGTSRRLGGTGLERVVAPFSARSVSAGYGSAASVDEGARGEQWMPLWRRPWTASELCALFAEGRSQVGARRTDSALDMARAVARLGVARGVDAFERYGYIERNGKSNYAVPLGRWTVRAEPLANLVDDLEVHQWWPQLRRAARDDHAPGSLRRLERRLEDAVMEALAVPAQPRHWQQVLLALADIEQQLVQSGSYTAEKHLRPLPSLSPRWIAAADDGGPELPLALSLAGAFGARNKARLPVDPARNHWLPLEPTGRFATRERGLAQDPRVVVHGRDAESDLIALVQRRLVEAESGARRTLPLQARPGAAARLDDLMALVRGEVDLPRVMSLARALGALRWSEFTSRHAPIRPTACTDLDPAWAAFRLCHLPPRPPGAGLAIPVDPAICRLLATGDAPRAFALARRRLGAAGIQTPLRGVLADANRARRIAASLAFPIHPLDAETLADFLDPRGDEAAPEPSHVR